MASSIHIISVAHIRYYDVIIIRYHSAKQMLPTKTRIAQTRKPFKIGLDIKQIATDFVMYCLLELK
jgi:hypothetical protein